MARSRHQGLLLFIYPRRGVFLIGDVSRSSSSSFTRSERQCTLLVEAVAHCSYR